MSYALCLFFAKLIAYTFLYWLPFYIKSTPIQNQMLSSKEAGAWRRGGRRGRGLLPKKKKKKRIYRCTWCQHKCAACLCVRAFVCNAVCNFCEGGASGVAPDTRVYALAASPT